ncbi:NFX1-type zinc finger-containing protein 1-like isoform X3 [Pseudophryne corroboree]|uniref:NFX1-type zinc finger-containing protein 1-like isoform X3 n=1 Tax=Pseudophryne corroboree TaxID=495146 RepID=UPI0030817DB1
MNNSQKRSNPRKNTGSHSSHSQGQSGGHSKHNPRGSNAAKKTQGSHSQGQSGDNIRHNPSRGSNDSKKAQGFQSPLVPTQHFYGFQSPLVPTQHFYGFQSPLVPTQHFYGSHNSQSQGLSGDHSNNNPHGSNKRDNQSGDQKRQNPSGSNDSKKPHGGYSQGQSGERSRYNPSRGSSDFKKTQGSHNTQSQEQSGNHSRNNPSRGSNDSEKAHEESPPLRRPASDSRHPEGGYSQGQSGERSRHNPSRGSSDFKKAPGSHNTQSQGQSGNHSRNNPSRGSYDSEKAHGSYNTQSQGQSGNHRRDTPSRGSNDSEKAHGSYNPSKAKNDFKKAHGSHNSHSQGQSGEHSKHNPSRDSTDSKKAQGSHSQGRSGAQRSHNPFRGSTYYKRAQGYSFDAFSAFGSNPAVFTNFRTIGHQNKNERAPSENRAEALRSRKLNQTSDQCKKAFSRGQSEHGIQKRDQAKKVLDQFKLKDDRLGMKAQVRSLQNLYKFPMGPKREESCQKDFFKETGKINHASYEKKIDSNTISKLSALEPSEVILKLVAPGSGLKEFLNKTAVDFDVVEGFLKILTTVIGCTTSRQNLTYLLSQVQDSVFLNQVLPFHILDYSKVLTEEHKNLSFFDLTIILITELASIFPSSSFIEVKIMYTLLENTFKELEMSEKLVPAEVEKKLIVLQNFLQHLQEKKTEGTLRSDNYVYIVGNRENMEEDFRSLSIYPTHKDIYLSENPSMRPNIIDGSYTDVKSYLDTHFSLLREDFIRPLRDGISELVALKNKDLCEARFDDIRIYFNAQILYPMYTNAGIVHQVKFKTTNLKNVCWEISRRLLYGSFVCLSKDNFKNMLFATVADRSVSDLKKGVITLMFTEESRQELAQYTLQHDIFVMIEATTYFEAFRHVLEGLKEMAESEIPFQNYIVHCNTAVSQPLYLLENRVGYTLKELIKTGSFTEEKLCNMEYSGNVFQRKKFDVLDFSSWPTKEELQLDRSQFTALQIALTSELSIIQGPPGTGKTYVGLKIVHALLANSNLWNHRQSPILIVCYTNHALDQFLEGILQQLTCTIVRVGSRSSSEILQECSLSKIRSQKSLQSFPGYMRAMHAELSDEKEDIEEILNKKAGLLEYATKTILHEDILGKYMPPHHLECLMSQREYLESTSRVSCKIAEWLGTSKAYQSTRKDVDAFEFETDEVESDVDPFESKNCEEENDVDPFETENYGEENYVDPYETENYEEENDVDHFETENYEEESDVDPYETENFEEENDVDPYETENYEEENDVDHFETENYEEESDVDPYETENFEEENDVDPYETENYEEENDVDHFETENYEEESDVDPFETENFEEENDVDPFETENCDEEDNVDPFETENWEEENDVDPFETENCEEESSGPHGDDNTVGEETDDPFIRVCDEAELAEAERMIEEDYYIKEQIRLARQRAARMFVPEEYDREDQNSYTELDDENDWQIPKNMKKKKEKEVKSELGKANNITEEHCKVINDLWQLPIQKRWEVYRCWRSKYLSDIHKEIFKLQNLYQIVINRMTELRNQEDLLILQKADIIGMTTTGAAKFRRILQNVQPKIVIVEEAAEVLEAHIITTLSSSCQHLILIGDHQQLRPSTTVYELAKNFNLEVSMFERLIRMNIPYVRLDYQHRMRPEIARLLTPHIYEKLENHESVLHFDNIKGVCHNLFFVDHNYPEEHFKEGKSHQNAHEAAFVKSLCLYFIHQGYSPSDITILTTYSGQLHCLQKMMPKSQFEGVRVCVVDRFQGEENEIIILSLVRSNLDGNVGFLKIPNRVCVALSRAKKGLFCIGNMQILSKVPLWSKINEVLRENEQIGKELMLQCVNHPNTTNFVSKSEDFHKVPEGGCMVPCQYRLDCGHACTLSCHPYDQEHKAFKCRKPCAITCENGHKCRKICSDPCGKCQELVSKMIPSCRHIQSVPCSMSPDVFTCKDPCTRSLECGHKCVRFCGQFCKNCPEELKVTLECGHTIKTLCHVKTEADKNGTKLKCDVKCEEKLKCGHNCPGSCSSCLRQGIHMTCAKLCGIMLFCSHACGEKCSSDCFCMRSCEKKCFHGKCPMKCSEPCTRCTKLCGWGCMHKRCTKLCWEPCDREACDKPCRKTLKCGHSCIGLCGEPCPKKCRVCDADEVNELFFGTEADSDARFVQLMNCPHFFEVTKFSEWINQKEEDQVIKLKSCPKCSKPIKQTLRYGSLVKETHSDLENVKELIVYKWLNQLEMFLSENDAELRHFPEANSTVQELQDSGFTLCSMILVCEKIKFWQKLGTIINRAEQSPDSLAKVLSDIHTLASSIQKAKSKYVILEKNYELFILALETEVSFLKTEKPFMLRHIRNLIAQMKTKQHTKSLIEVQAQLKKFPVQMDLINIIEENKVLLNTELLRQDFWHKCPAGHIYPTNQDEDNTLYCPRCSFDDED